MKKKIAICILVCAVTICVAILTGCGANEESSAPPKEIAPEVVTSSHMREKVGEEIPWEQLPREALELYSGQDTKYRISFLRPNEPDEERNQEFYRQCEDGVFGTIYRGGLELGHVGYIPPWYAEVDENGLRTLLGYPTLAVELVDQIPNDSFAVYPKKSAPEQ